MKLVTEVFDYDDKAIRVLEKLGFEKEAALQKVALKSGNISDLYFYTLSEKDVESSPLTE